MKSSIFIKEQLDNGYDIEDFGEVIFDSGWENDHKDYSYNSTVIKVTNVDNDPPELEDGLYRINTQRTGDYYSDYEFEVLSVEKVEAYETRVIAYRKIEEQGEVNNGN